MYQKDHVLFLVESPFKSVRTLIKIIDVRKSTPESGQNILTVWIAFQLSLELFAFLKYMSQCSQRDLFSIIPPLYLQRSSSNYFIFILRLKYMRKASAFNVNSFNVAIEIGICQYWIKRLLFTVAFAVSIKYSTQWVFVYCAVLICTQILAMTTDFTLGRVQ